MLVHSVEQNLNDKVHTFFIWTFYASSSSEADPLQEVPMSSPQCLLEKNLDLQPCETTSEEADDKPTLVQEDLCGLFKADGVEFHLDFSKQKIKEQEKFDDDETEQFFIGKTWKDTTLLSHGQHRPCRPYGHVGM